MTQADTLRDRNPLEPFVLDDHRLLVGDLVLDLAMRTITSHSGQIVKLSGNEFVILAVLTKNTGRFVPQDELLVAVAGANERSTKQPRAREPVHASVVDTYIKYLRLRLQEADSSATIERSPDHSFRLRP